MKRVMLVMFLSSLTLFEADAGRKDKDTFNEGGMRHRITNTNKKRSSSSELSSEHSPLIEETDQGEKSARSYNENSNPVSTSSQQVHEDEKPDWFPEGERRFGEWLKDRGNRKESTDLEDIAEDLCSCKTENGFRIWAEGYGIVDESFLKYMQNFCRQMKSPGWMFAWEKQKK